MGIKDVKQFLLEIDFQTQGKVVGDSTAKHGTLDFSKGLMCHAFEYGVDSQYDEGNGQYTGRRRHKPIRIVREVDQASPLIFQALTHNEIFKTAKLSFVRPDNAGKLVAYHSIALEKGGVVRYRTWHGILEEVQGEVTQHHTNELESFDLTFTKITYSNDLKSKSSIDDWMTQ